jgi:hypothetical protein
MPESMGGLTILLFFRCFYRTSGPLECWIRSYVRSLWFGSRTLAVLSGLGRRNIRPGRWILSHLPLPIPDADSLTLYSTVVKLACDMACVCARGVWYVLTAGGWA